MTMQVWAEIFQNIKIWKFISKTFFKNLFVAFAGEEEYRTFDDLTPAEAKEKLGYLIDKMDKNGDSLVTEEELTVWIHYVQTKYIYDDTERQYEENDLDKDGKITWKEYEEHTYGFLSEEDMGK